MDSEKIREILSIYIRHGWKLRRVLLTPKLKSQLADSVEPLFGQVEIVDSGIDAVWFSRASTENRESWEIRRLSDVGYALVEVFDGDDEEEVREEIRQEMEAQMGSKK